MASPAEAQLRCTKFDTIEVTQPDAAVSVYYVHLNRPAQRNSLPLEFFSELVRAISLLSIIPSARVIVISSRGPHFCSGIEISSLASVTSPVSDDPAVAAAVLRKNILSLQDAISAIERCPKPVIAAIHGACVGAGVDLVAACDLRFCDDEAWFSVKEVDMALAADLGSLQRLPRIVGYGNAADLALTGRQVGAKEAKAMGLVSKFFSNHHELTTGVANIAKGISEKSAMAVMGTKAVLLKSRELTVEQGLEHVATWNTAMLRSQDLEEAVQAHMQKRSPIYSKM